MTGTSFCAVPVGLASANRFVVRHHRHSGPVNVALFAVGLVASESLPWRGDESDLAAVGVASLPVARALNDGATVEIRRVAVPFAAAPNLCSMIYGRLCRAAKALGWLRVVTYTAAGETGASLRAAGFVPVAAVEGGREWGRSEPQRRAAARQMTLPGAVGPRDSAPTAMRWEKAWERDSMTSAARPSSPPRATLFP